MRFARTAVVVVSVAALGVSMAWGEFRFPMPEFQSGYEQPVLHVPSASLTSPAIDIALLFGALCLASWLALKRRSRGGLFALSVFSVFYFGFWREGCVCSVGSLQNIVAALADSSYEVPLVVLVFFLLPLVFALFFGRVFCSAVCPLGAVQELVALRPAQIPKTTEAVLRLFPYVYLGLTVLSISTGAGFLICRYDPFVGFFRFGASFNMFLVGGIFLVGGVFIARPYCRFLCPYGVLLGWMSRFSKWHAQVTPSFCVQCRLCEEACPYNAIDAPIPSSEDAGFARVNRRAGLRRFGLLLLAAPLIVAAGVGVGLASHGFLARLHPTVRLAERVAAEERGAFTEMTIESEAFRGGKQTVRELFEDARGVKKGFRGGSAWLGAFLGIVVFGKLAGLSVARRRTDYQASRSACVSCGRCFAYCPVEEDSRA